MSKITVKVIRHESDNTVTILDTITRTTQRQALHDKLGRRRSYRAKFVTYKGKRYDITYLPQCYGDAAGAIININAGW